MSKLTGEQKTQLLAQVEHYLDMDCYDFSVDVGGVEIRAGAFAGLDEDAVMAELDDSDPNIDLVLDELAAAKKKHTHFIDMFDDNPGWAETRLSYARTNLRASSEHSLATFKLVLECEVCEAGAAFANGDLAHAKQELAQCAAVCIRGMEWIDEEMKRREENK